MVSDNLSDRRKKRRPGRPKTGVTPMTGVRLSAKLEDAIKGWAGKQEDQPTKAEAIRRLVELGLANKGGKAKGLMPPFLYRSPNTGQQVQGFVADAPEKTDKE
jgi:hypothetical protein